MSYDFSAKVQSHTPVGAGCNTNSLASAPSVSLQQPVRQFSISTLPSDTVYRCAHCSFADNNQAEVVAHAKNCQTGSPPTAQSLSFTVSSIIEDDFDGMSPSSPDSEPERRGRGLPLWSEKKIKVLLDGISQHVHIFSEDMRKIRRAWKLITRYTKDHAHFEVSSKQCSYKWSKLLGEYQTYMADTSTSRPAYLDQVHDIVSQNKKILNKPDIFSFIKTISKLPAETSVGDIDEAAPAVVHERLSGDELDLFSGEVSAEVVHDSALEATLEDCAQIHINEEGYEGVSLQPSLGDRPAPAPRPPRLWTTEGVRRLLKVITRYRELLARHTPVMIKYAWAVIAEETSKAASFSVTGPQCNHKWRALVQQFQFSHHQSTGSDEPTPFIAKRVRALHRAITSARSKEDNQDGDSDGAANQADTLAGDLEVDAGHQETVEDGMDETNLSDGEMADEIEWAADEPDEEELPSDVDMDHKGHDPDLARAIEAENRRNRRARDSSSGRGGLRLLFWTDDRLQVLVDTIYDHCYLLDCPGSRTTSTWKRIAAAVSKRGGFHVDYNRSLRKFRMLVKALLVKERRWPEPPYYPVLWRILRRLPPDCKSLPQKVMTSVIKTIQFVDCATSPKGDQKVDLLMNGGRDDDLHDGLVPADEGTVGDEPESKSGPEEKVNSKGKRAYKVSFLKRKVDEEEHEDGVNGVAKSTQHRRRRRDAGGSDAEDESFPLRKRKRPECECSEAIARLEHSMTVQQNRMKSSLDTLVASVGAIDARLLTTSNTVSNFCNGFLRSFNRLVDAKVAEKLKQHRYRSARDDSD